MVKAMQESYDEDVTDEFIKPINNSTGTSFNHTLNIKGASTTTGNESVSNNR